MKVELFLKYGYCKITKESGDKNISRSGYNGTTESTFLHKVKTELKKQGYDVIKKRIADDPGNMVDDRQQWIRTRKWDNRDDPTQFAIFNGRFATFDAGEEYNVLGEYDLNVL